MTGWTISVFFWNSESECLGVNFFWRTSCLLTRNQEKSGGIQSFLSTKRNPWSSTLWNAEIRFDWNFYPRSVKARKELWLRAGQRVNEFVIKHSNVWNFKSISLTWNCMRRIMVNKSSNLLLVISNLMFQFEFWYFKFWIIDVLNCSANSQILGISYDLYVRFFVCFIAKKLLHLKPTFFTSKLLTIWQKNETQICPKKTVGGTSQSHWCFPESRLQARSWSERAPQSNMLYSFT